MMKKVAIPCLLLALLFSCETKRDHQSVIHEELAQVFEEHGLMGMSVGLIAHGELYYNGNIGYQEVIKSDPMTSDTYVRIASISKMYTSLAVMTLWEKGLVHLDTPASVYLGWELKHPVYPEQPITLRHLLDHRSGIRDGTGYRKFLQEMIEKESDIRTLFLAKSEYNTADMFSSEPPGVYFSYTNCTWGLIASIIEQVSGQRFDVYCKENLFQPMGIGSSFNVMDVPVDKIAPIFRYEDSLWVAQIDDYSQNAPTERSYPNYIPGRNGLIYGPQGSLRTSLNDLWITADMFLNKGKVNGNQIIAPTTLSYFQQDRWEYDGKNGDTWGNFWHSYTKGMHFLQNREKGDIIFPDRKLWGHPGIAYGLLSDFYIDPETQSGVIFFTNGSEYEYQYAKGSSFYDVEADVFKVLFHHLKRIEAEKN